MIKLERNFNLKKEIKIMKSQTKLNIIRAKKFASDFQNIVLDL